MSKSPTSFPFSLGAFQHRVFLVAALATILVGLVCPGFAGETYPVSATLIPWSDRANLQAYLNADAALAVPLGCRLEPGRDYNQSSGGPAVITVGSGAKLYALNSRICPVNIAAGATDVHLSGLAEGTITFLAGTPSQVTRRVTLDRVHYVTLQGTGCRIDELTWIDAYNVNIHLDCHSSGFVRNFRGIRVANQNNTQPYYLEGNSQEESYGNSIVIGNFLNGASPEGPRVYWKNIREWLSVQIGAESYWGPQFPWFSPIGVKAVRAIGTGGLVDHDPVWETDSPDVLLVGDQMATFWRGQLDSQGHPIGNYTDAPTHHYLPGVKSVVEVNFPYPPQPWDGTRTYRMYEQVYRNNQGYRSLTDSNLNHDPASDNNNWQIQTYIGFDNLDDDPSSDKLRARFFDYQTTDAKTIQVNGQNSPGNLSPEQLNQIRTTVAAPTAGLLEPWSPPTYATPPSDFSGLPVGAMSRAQIQAALDTGSGLCVLPAGVYQLDGPILLGTRADGVRRVLVGAGKSQTVLVAPNSNTDLINEKNDGSGASSIDLIDLTLKGGRWGVNLFSIQVGGMWVQRQYLDSDVANVCIRDMSAGGWHLENIYAMDNNALQGVDFVNCRIGWQQIGGNDPSNNTWAYMDKTLWLGCQWLNCGKAFDLHPTRNSGANVLLECRIEGTTNQVMYGNHDPVSFINCDLRDNAGDPAIFEYGQVFFVSTRFHDSGQAQSLFDGYLPTFEGCTFTRSGASTCKVLSTAREATIGTAQNAQQNDYNGRCSHFLNSYVGMPVGQWYNGSSINSVFADPSDAYRAGAIAYADANRPDWSGAPIPTNQLRYTVIDPSTPIPSPAVLLTGHAFQQPLTALPTGLPHLTSPASASVNFGNPAVLSITATATGGSPVFSADLLPPGLALNSTNGLISGTPTRVGSWLCPVHASNSNGLATAWLRLTVIGQPPGAPEFGTFATTQYGVGGTAFSLSAAASGATSYEASGLPPGLSLDPATGLISGTVDTLGSFTSVLLASGPGGTSAIQISFNFAFTTPTPSLWTNPATSQRHLAVTFRQIVGTGALVKTSTNLLAWSSAPADVITLGSPIATGDGTETLTYRGVQPIAAETRRFFRIRLVQP